MISDSTLLGIAGQTAPGSASSPRAFLQIRAGRRLMLAIVVAGFVSLLVCVAFYLFEVERLTARQLADLTHRMGQVLRSAEPPVAGRALRWHYDEKRKALIRRGGTSELLIDDSWLAERAQGGIRLFALWRGAVQANSLGAAGAGEAAAITPQISGLVARNHVLFIQAPARWDDSPDSPFIIAQQPLSLPFSLGETAVAGLMLWAILSSLIWLTVGIWLGDALKQVQFLAYHDPLTGLINRAALQVSLPHMMAEARRNESLLAVLYLDLDRFKTINDSLGHGVGDLVLQEVARRLQAVVRETDFVARLGGDEFVVIAGELTYPGDAAGIARKIIEALQQPVAIGGNKLQTGTSIGITTYQGDAENRPESLLKQADSAMYSAKQGGRGRYHFYDASIGARADQRFSLEMQMRQAIADEQFELHYQPIIDSTAGRRLVGFEALLRWPHPAGAIAPTEFIPLAEESGLIVPLGEWALRQACRRMQAWRLAFPASAPGSMSVNVSVRQLHDESFPGRVAAALRDSGLAPGALTLELTESLYIDKHTAVPAALRQLRQMGIRLAMDDFGTGYSALASLSRLPLDRLKIDRAFVSKLTHAPEELAIVRTIIGIARQLDLEVVAEGVETSEQATALDEQGCHLHQGWLYGKALPVGEIEKLLESAAGKQGPSDRPSKPIDLHQAAPLPKC